MPTKLELAIISEDIYHSKSKIKGDWERQTGAYINDQNGFFSRLYTPATPSAAP